MRAANSNFFYYMVGLSFFLHVCILGTAAVAWKKRFPLYVPKVLSVNLIGPLSRSRETAGAGQPAAKKIEVKKAVKPAPPEKKKTTAAKPRPKKITPGVSKQEMQRLEDRMALLRATKRVEELAKLRSVVDISTKDIAEKVKKAGNGKNSGESNAESGSATGEAQEGLLDNYITAISTQIRKEWVYPELSVNNDLEVIVSVRIDPEGNITVLGIEKSSGNSRFDRSAMRAIVKASPVKRPPFPLPDFGMRFHP